MPAHPKIIPEVDLRKLYSDDNLSTDAIGKIFNCNHVTVLNYLKKYSIPRRTKLGNRKPVDISRRKLIDLYENKKLNQSQIAKKLGHSPYGIQRWMKIYGIKGRPYYESHKISPKYDFSGDLVEKAYLIGFRLGDLNVCRVRKLIQARCSTTIQNQVDLIEGLFKKYGHVHIWKAKRGTYEIIVLLNNSFSFLLPKKDEVESWILDSKKYFFSFLAGYSDAESCILIRTSSLGNKGPFAGFELASYDKTLLQQVAKILKISGLIFPVPFISHKAGINSHGQKWNKDCWKISVYQKSSLWKLLNWLEPFMKHKSKLKSLVEAKKNIISRNNLPYCKPINLEVSVV